MRSVLSLCVCVFAGGLLGFADECMGGAASMPVATRPTTSPTDPRGMMQVTWTAVLDALRVPGLDTKAREDAVERIAEPVIDFQTMAKLALGRQNWQKFTPDQRKQFLALFVKRLKGSYRERIARYEGESVVVKQVLPTRQPGQPADPPEGPRRTSPKGTAYVPVELVTKEQKINILHKLRKVSGQWKMYDTEIEGVSILMTYRSQFNDILRTGTVDDLLKRLAEPKKDR